MITRMIKCAPSYFGHVVGYEKRNVVRLFNGLHISDYCVLNIFWFEITMINSRRYLAR